MRVRGLKSLDEDAAKEWAKVAPHAGAWIEISADSVSGYLASGRTPCGCVD